MFAEDQLEMPLFKEYTKMHTSQKAIHICLKENPTGYVRTVCVSHICSGALNPRTGFSFLYSVIRSSVPRSELTGEATVGEESKRSD